MAKMQKITMSQDYDIPNGIEVIDTSSGLVKWGRNNLYSQYLNYLYYTCAVHQGIINRKTAFILGKGLEETIDNGKTVKMFNHVIRDLISSNEISDSYYVELRLDYTSKSKIQKVKYLPFETVRVMENGEYQISKDWTDTEEEVRTLRTYESKQDIDQSVIYAFKTKPKQYLIGGEGKKISKSYYPEPNYKGGIKSILTDIEAVNYQYSSFRNGFSLGTIVSLNNGNIVDPQDKKEIEEEILENSTGSDNAGGVIILYANGKDSEPTVLQLSGDQLHERYTTMSKDVRDNILKAHGVISPSLFGFQEGGSFNQSEMDIAYILMKDDYFLQRQEQILECVNFVDEVNGGSGEIEFTEYSIKGGADNKTSVAINEMSPLVANKALSVLTINEQRALSLSPPIEGGDVLQNTNEESTTAFNFSKKSDKDIIEVFKKFGIEKDDSNFLFTEALNTEEAFKSVFAKKKFSAVDVQVLNLIEEGNTFDKIYKALGINAIDLTKIYQRLIDGEKLKEGKVTREGKLDIVRSDVSKYEIRYTYEVKSGYGAELIPTSRDFCTSVIGLNRMYSREDITNMSTALGLPPEQIWRYRGGWYHNPKTDKNEPSCRHEWKQSLVYIK